MDKDDAVGEVGLQVIDVDASGFEFVVEPAMRSVMATECTVLQAETHHFEKVFC